MRQPHNEEILKEIMLKTELVLQVMFPRKGIILTTKLVPPKNQHLTELNLKTEEIHQEKLFHKELKVKTERINQKNQRHRESNLSEVIRQEMTAEDCK